MGGLIIKVDDSLDHKITLPVPFYPNLTLTARGVALLAKCDLLPDLHEAEIIDKSKADGLAKLVACGQAGWMLVQVIGRVALRLPITLLEVNTLGHVVCAFAIYILCINHG